MAMTPAQIAAELQRKKNMGENPTNPANQAAFDKLTPSQPTYAKYGGKDNYVTGQNSRWQAANESNDQDLMTRLITDSKKRDYTLNPYTPQASQPSNAPAKASSDDLLSRLNSLMDKQTARELPQFNYDPNSDPQYQAALNRAKANSETASGNAMAELNRRGILNSTITGDRLGQIEQAEYGRVSDTILPQLMQQAYGRFRDTVSDQYQVSRDEINDLRELLGITSDLDQRGFDNTMRQNEFDWGKNYDTANLTGNFNGQRTLAGQTQDYNQMADKRDYEYMVGRDDVADSKWASEFNEMIKQNGIQNAISWANNAISKQNADRLSAGGSGGGSGGSGGSKPPTLTQLLSIWKASGVAPEGIPGVQPGAKLYDPVAARKAAEETGGTTMWDKIKGIIGSIPAAGSSSKSNQTVSDDDISKYLNQ